MSIGTPVLVASGAAVAGSTTLVVTVGAGITGTPSSPAGNCIAVFCSENLTSSNMTGLTDSQGNIYTAQPIGQGTSLEGLWFVCPNAKALTGGTDTITLTCSGTGGGKTLQAVSCSGVALTSPVDQFPAAASGNSTSPSQTVPAGTAANELLLSGVVNQGGGGLFTFNAPITQLNITRPGSNQFASVGADVLTSAGAVTAGGTMVSAPWVETSLTLLPATGARGTSLVGSTTPKMAFANAGCYEFGNTQDQCDSNFVAAVGRSLPNRRLSFTKKFWNENDYHLTNNFNNLANYISYGTNVLLAVFPPVTSRTAQDQTNLANFLASLVALGFNASNCEVVLWQEPEIGNKFGGPGGGGPSAFGAGMAFFGPVVVASGLPMVLDVGMGAGETQAQNYYNAGLAAAGCTYTGIYSDFYFNAYKNNIRLASIAAIADGAGLPYGLGEFGCHTTDDYAAYFNYITGFFQARLLAGKPNANFEYYQGQCSLTGAGDLTSPILQPTDPRVPFYQSLFDTLTSPVTQNTVTVTSPGNQSGTAGVAIAPLQITAIDSDPGQTLTFTATGLPAGLSISTSGLITGTPAAQSVNNVTITATDGTGASGAAGFTWTISPVVTNTVTITNPGTQSNVLGATVALGLTAADSNPAITTFTWGAANLPRGLSISSTTGTISGNPSLTGSFSVTVTATDATGSSGNATFTWNITNPQTLPHGAFQTLPPVTPSPVAGLGPAQQLSYEISLGLVAGAGSTVPFTAITLNFYDFDALPGIQSPVATVTFRCPMGTLNDPNGPAIISGRGPMRGAFMRIQAHNVDTVDATLTSLQVVGVARAAERDDWRWDSGGNAPVIPTYTNATAAASSLVLGGVAGLSVVHGTTVTRLCSMYAGQAQLRVHLFNGGPASLTVKVSPQPSGLFTSQDLFSTAVGNAGNDNFFTLALPRGPCLLQFVGDAVTDATVSAELIAIET